MGSRGNREPPCFHSKRVTGRPTKRDSTVMLRLSIEIADTAPAKPEPDHKAVIPRDCYKGFVELAERLGYWDNVLDLISIECDDCGSFLTDFGEFYTAIEKVMEFIDSKDMASEFSIWQRVFGKLEIVRDKIYEYSGRYDDWPQEIAVLLKLGCSCNEFFIGDDDKIEDLETDQIEPEPGDKMGIYIGPRRFW